MKNIKFKTIAYVSIGILIALFSLRFWIERGLERVDVLDTKEYAIDFIDDSGYRVQMETHGKRIISLYSAHTENLFKLGLDKEIIGVGTADVYPVAATKKQVYDYKSDPEKVIAANPDLVIIRPFIDRNYPNFAKSLRRAGLNVVSLYPESFDRFHEYFERMGMITGTHKRSLALLEEFDAEMARIEAMTAGLDPKVNVYFESSDREYKTVTPDSMPAKAIAVAGGANVATDVEPIEKGSSIAAYGIERILEQADVIDVYLTQRGAMGGGGNWHSIRIRPGFDAMKAVQNKRVVEVNQKLISSPTFRYLKGLNELTRAFYPDVYDTYDHLNKPEALTREELAELFVRFENRMIFTPSSRYYDKTYEGHTYGYFEDIPVDHPNFDFIETAVLGGYIDGFKVDGLEEFRPEDTMTRDTFIQTVYLLADVQPSDKQTEVLDLASSERPKVLQMLVDAGIVPLVNGHFHPDQPITGHEALVMLDKVRDLEQAND